jgi:hypothetical protein
MGDLFLTGKERSVQDRSEEANVGGVVSHLPTSFQPLINLFFSKKWGGGKVKKNFQTYHFSLTFQLMYRNFL